MAQLKSLLVNGTSRFLNTIYATDLNVSGTTSFAGVTTTGLTVNGAATVTGTLTLTKTTDLSGTANNSPALVIGGAATAAHIEIDANEIQGKATGTTTEEIFINNDGGKVNLSNSGKIYANNGTFRTQTLEINGSTYYFNSSGNINANGITASTSILGNATITTGVATDLYVSNELRSAKHTIETISHLGGVFYVAPSIELPSGNNVSITAISGNTISATINDSSITTTAFSPTWWAANSIIKIAGSIAGIPIGTCSGTIQADLTANKLQINFTYPNQTKKALATGNNQASNGLSITLTTIGGTKPIGIYMSALGDSTWVDQTALNKTAISIYGGTTDGAVPSDTTPVVRIGNLAGLPKVNGNSPVGWGIYTNHGYFDGVIVSNEGKIGGWTLGLEKIYSGTHNTWSHASSGLFLGTTRIAGGNGGTWYLDQAGTGKIGRWTFASNGEFSTTVSSNTAGMGNNTYAFWAGAASGNAANAPFRIKYDGSAVFTNATIGDPDGYHVTVSNTDVGIFEDATNKRASFGETTIIGKPYVSGASNNESHLKMDYHSLQLIDKNGGEYFYVSDLRDSTGTANIKELFIGDGSTTDYYLAYTATSNSYTVTIDGVTASPTKTVSKFTFSTAPSENADILVVYSTTSNTAKAFTFGTRDATGTVGGFSASFGYSNAPQGYCSFAEGRFTNASGQYSHAEGYNTTANGVNSHAEGYDTTASGISSHAEGDYTTASGSASHAEGASTIASGIESHAEGENTTASGITSHAEGFHTTASGDKSHTSGQGTIAQRRSQTAIGEYNVADTTGTTVTRGSYAFIIGNGTSSATADRSNALTVDWNGEVALDLDVDSSASSSTAATSGTDMDLFNAIRALGWYDDVIS